VKKNAVVTFVWSLILFALIFPPAASYAGLPVPPAPPLPRLIIPAPPPVFLIPGTYAYFVPDVDAELFFYSGFWYRSHEGRWYRAPRYSGPWGFIVPNRVPGVLIHLPPGYRTVPPGHQRIPYIQLKKNWKTWERYKHWDKPRKAGKQGKNKKRDREQSDHGFGGGHKGGHGR
jgi:hypothetical protein